MSVYRHNSFDESALKLVSDKYNIVLNSGGPLMKIVTIEGDNALCSWNEGTAKDTIGLFPIACLSKLAPLDIKQGAKP